MVQCSYRQLMAIPGTGIFLKSGMKQSWWIRQKGQSIFRFLSKHSKGEAKLQKQMKITAQNLTFKIKIIVGGD